eukprot:GILI01038418.1.p2 GENE.GILI01038418.1~~GILI01038418.1.p2  ORF type:complete len:184 (-),score=47.97 GILI01038418.1:33-584(-)
MSSSLNRFLLRNKEKADFNQYWFSEKTISFMVEQVETFATRTAFLSTPSIYFSLKNADVKSRSKCFDFDQGFASDPNFVFYDFNHPENIPADLHHQFDFIVIDPPFITREVWEKYAAACRLLLAEGGKILCSTIAENADMMAELLGVAPKTFRPSIPNLVYQYSLYANYDSEGLSQLNPEVDS